MIKSKTLWGLLLIVLFVLMLAACAPDREGVKQTAQDSGGESPGDQGSEETEKPEQLKVWVNDEEEAIAAAEEMFSAYKEETGIEVVYEKVPMPDQLQKLSLAGPTGDGPDLFFQPQDRLGDVVAQGLAVPMEYNAEELNGFSEVAIDAFTYEGETYGAPVTIDTYFVYYNKSLVEAPPENIEEVYDLSKKLTDASKDQYGFLISPEFYYLYSFINSYGGYVFGEENGVYDPTDIGLNNEGSIKGLQEFKKFVDEGLIPKSLTVDVIDGLFTEGKVGMVVSGPWNIPIYKEALGDDLATAPLPMINGKTAPSFVGVKSWLVSSYSEQPEWAMDLAKFMTNGENSQLYYDLTGEMPPRPEILNEIDDAIYEGYTEQISNGTPMPNIPEMSIVWDIDDAIELIVNGGDVEEVLNDVVSNIKQKIDMSAQ
ncbi:arabinogalactan oligomer / maltooligosaccharide transport system substrate-binding protein [Gracilibacillus ureilyticus]|uniref:Maltodextrin-binding protein n=1 Tax=Gracilibacillus ureilyticus TaxID=531814 RepID=A0A1H9T156_9BACI|nr:extracellular solute-binding protein [Gracilibacillus ureilyticus]SER90965.1 arabinogalactan oligomer / maltooligosaccharide transport system substrate-binding protein [Gracilibacillus ureilyticus]